MPGRTGAKTVPQRHASDSFGASRWPTLVDENRSAARLSFNCHKFSKNFSVFQPLFTEWSKNGRFWSVDISVSIKAPQYIVVFGFAEFKPARVILDYGGLLDVHISIFLFITTVVWNKPVSVS